MVTTIYGFRDSVPVLKINQTFQQYSAPIQAIATRREQPTRNSFDTLKTVYTYSKCIINQLWYCWEIFQPIFVVKKAKFDWFYEWFSYSYLQCERVGGILKCWVEMNVLCIVDQDHQWWVIPVDHTSKFKVI